MRHRLHPIQLLILIDLCVICVFSRLFFPNLFVNTGVIFSIIGTWLSSLGIIGKKRLRSWEQYLNSGFQNADDIPEIIQRKSYKLLENKFVLVYSFVVVSLTILFMFPLENFFLKFLTEQTYRTLTTIILLLILPIAIFVPLSLLFSHILAMLIKLFSIPYSLVFFFENDDTLERTILLIGAILLTIGILIG